MGVIWRVRDSSSPNASVRDKRPSAQHEEASEPSEPTDEETEPPVRYYDQDGNELDPETAKQLLEQQHPGRGRGKGKKNRGD